MQTMPTCTRNRLRKDADSISIILSFITSLKACAKKKDLYQGSKIHVDIHNCGLLEKSPYLGNTLVSMYAKCGALVKAQQVLDDLPVRDTVSWNALIGGYTRCGQGKEALESFWRLQSEGLSPDAFTYACILKACALTQDGFTGEKIHNEIVSQGLLENDVVLGTSLVDMYAKCGVFTKAEEVLDKLPARDVISWNTLITGYVQHEEGEDALRCFHRMRREGLSPDAVTYACILKACGITLEVDLGKQIHDEIVNQGLLEKNVVLANALVYMYAKCGSLTKAQEVLDKISMRDVISWSAMIAGYAEKGQVEKAFGCFRWMRSENLHPNAITYASILKAYGTTQDIDIGRKIHDEIICQGSLAKDVVVGTALVGMYAKCGKLKKAQEVFDELLVRDVVSWCALIVGYAQQGEGEQALCCFQKMRSEGLSPDVVTYACILKACGISVEADIGKQIHEEVVSQGLLEKDSVLGNALVNMYAKCGVLSKAKEVFDELPVRDLVAWNALITGYAQQGQGDEALACFKQMRTQGLSPNLISWNAVIGGYAQQGLAEKALYCFQWMQKEGTSPNAITYLIVLNACSHAGLVDVGQMHFEEMRKKFGIMPDKEHQTCMVDLFGRAQHFDKAIRVITEMSFSDYPPLWFALLGACAKWGNVKLGKLAFDNLVELDGCNAAAYVSMANIYAAAGMKEDAKNIKHIGEENAVWKQPPSSCWVDEGGFCFSDLLTRNQSSAVMHHSQWRDSELVVKSQP